jgi:glyoxylase-like metal-dependent hydrolase (beta-lactamase superfamily II)
MSHTFEFNGPIYQAHVQLAEWAALNVYLVKGAQYAVWIDSGVKSMLPLFLETMQRAGVRNQDLRFILHTHSHHDHMGCNASLKKQTGCLIAAPSHYAAWHADFERHYNEFARPFPHLMPDTPELRAEVLDILDAPAPLDLFIDEGVQFNLGGGVRLRAFSLPGHLLAELCWFEESTRTLILGDAVTMLEGPVFHSHLSVSGYRSSLDKLRRLLDDLNVALVVFGHFPPMPPPQVRDLIAAAHIYINAVETTIFRIIAAQQTVTLEHVWRETCNRMERAQEFRSLNMVNAHLHDLTERGICHQVAPETYAIGSASVPVNQEAK